MRQLLPAALVRPIVGFFEEVIAEFNEDGCAPAAGAIAFYALFSFPPLLVIVVSVAGVVWGRDAAQSEVVSGLGLVVSSSVAEQAGLMLQEATSADSGNTLATAIGVLGLVVGATGVLTQLQHSMNQAWNVAPHPETGVVWGVMLKRLVSLVVVIVGGVALLLSLALQAALSRFAVPIAERLGPWGAELLSASEVLASLVVLWLVIGAVFRLLPDALLAWRDVALGAFITATLLLLGRWALAQILGLSDPGSAYGAAGWLAVLLVWVYYAALIFLFGVEVTQVVARRQGRSVRPESGAVTFVREVRFHRADGTEVSTASSELDEE